MRRVAGWARRAASIFFALALAACGGGDGSVAPTAPGAMNGIDLTTATELMRLCLESYQMLDDFQNGTTFSLPAPYTLQAQFSTEEHYFGEETSGTVPIAFIATAGNAIYLVFRGTKTISEWVSDASFSQVDYRYVADGGKTENGFTAIYADIHAAILQKLASLAMSETYTTLYITGHSLGGALTVLAAPEVVAQTPFAHPVVYTFAGPRAGDPIFATQYNGSVGNTWRVVNTNDEVPNLPDVVTTVFGPPPENRPTLYFYDHVDAEYPITFGQPIRSVSDLLFNHSSCNYYATLCDATNDAGQCKAAGQGLDGCSFQSP